MCNAIVRDCPADFGFACPTRKDFLGVSYGVLSSETNNLTCNYVGNDNLDSGNSDEQISTGGASLVAPFTSVKVACIIVLLFYVY